LGSTLAADIGQKFNELKTLLNAQTSTFHIVTISRSDKNPINSCDLKFVEILLRKLINGDKMKLVSEELTEINNVYKNIAQTNYANMGINNATTIADSELKYLQSDALLNEHMKTPNVKLKVTSQKLIDMYAKALANIKSCITTQKFYKVKIPTGICVFNEYFFFGHGNPIPRGLAENISMQFSLINPSIIWACNFLTLSPSSKADVFNLYKNNFPLNSPSAKRCKSDITMNPAQKLENKSFFVCNNEILATYNKGTYVSECENVLKIKDLQGPIAYYKFGDWNMHQKGAKNKNLAQCFIDNTSAQICMDYAFRQGKTCKFQILQAHGEIPAYYSHESNRDFAEFLIYADHRLVGQEIGGINNWASLFQRTSHDEAPAAPAKVGCRINFQVGVIDYRIDIYTIS
jgi:hypothetical protein